MRLVKHFTLQVGNSSDTNTRSLTAGLPSGEVPQLVLHQVVRSSKALEPDEDRGWGFARQRRQ